MLSSESLSNKVIIITGGGTGLGKSMAEAFAYLGANVAICSRKAEVIEATAKEISEKTGKNILAIACDVRDYSQIENVLQTTIATFGKVDVWINNAAGNFISPTERLSNRAFDSVVDIVLKGSYNGALAAGKYWIENKMKGLILNIVTTYSWTGSGFVVPSAIAKAGVLNMTKSLAAEWGKYGIRSNAIAPGPFPTQGAWQRLFPEALAKKLDPLNKIPLKRYGEHYELANLASYLVSDFSSYVNGEVVTIDGGEWLYGAGEFTYLDQIPGEMWDIIEQQTKGKK